MYATIDYRYINHALAFARLRGVMVAEVKSRGGDPSKGVGIEIKCDIHTPKGIRKHTVTFEPNSITYKQGFFGLKSHTIHLPPHLDNPSQYLQLLYNQLGVTEPQGCQPSYFNRNEILSILLDRQVVDFDIKEESVTIYNLGTSVPFIKIKYRYESFKTCTFEIKTVNTPNPQRLDGLGKPFSELYRGLSAFLVGR